MKRYWFKRKYFGWGWYPSTWEGWVVITVWTFAVVKIFLKIDQNSHSESDTLRPFLLWLFVFMFILIGICYWKGEKPRWQWNGKPIGKHKDGYDKTN